MGWQVVLLSLAFSTSLTQYNILSRSCIEEKKFSPISGNIKVEESNCFPFVPLNQMHCLLISTKKKKNTPTPWGFGFREMRFLSMEPKDRLQHSQNNGIPLC